MSEQLDMKIVDKIKKLLDLAAKNDNPNEAASAAAKAQALMEQHNLSAAAVEGSTGLDGKREKQLVEGGFYAYKRELWQAVADLNFCVYWSQKFRTDDLVSQTHRINGVYVGMRKVHAMRRRHMLVGRVVNTRTTVVMAQYLEQAIERVLRERLSGNDENMKSNWAHSFRKGAAYRLVQKLQDRREEMIAKEEQERRRAERQGVSTSTALTIAAFSQSEEDANMDFMYGEGWSARRRQRAAERAAERERELREWREWCAANPEEARKQEEEARKREERNARRRKGGRASYGRRDNVDAGAFWSGSDEAETIGIDPQAEGRKDRVRIAGPKAMHVGER